MKEFTLDDILAMVREHGEDKLNVATEVKDGMKHYRIYLAVDNHETLSFQGETESFTRWPEKWEGESHITLGDLTLKK